MIINATKEQVQKMAVRAIEASRPMGMGFLHYNPNDEFKPEDIQVNAGGIFLDYVRGRMVKFYARQVNETTWDFDDEITPAYQSWSRKYSSYQDLFDAVVRDE